MLQHDYLVFNETIDPHGRPVVWIPYGRDEFTGLPDLYPRYMLPLAVEKYEIKFGVLPLSSVTSTTSTPMVVSTPNTPDEHLALLHCAPDNIPPHLAPQFIPKVIREGTTVRLCQYRYDEQRKEFTHQTLAQPLRDPTPGQIRPHLRISCPSLDKKFCMEEVLDFLRFYNIRSDGSFYRATPERIHDGRGYGPNGLVAPPTKGKSSETHYIC